MATKSTREQVYSYLQTQSFMSLATASKDGEPHAAIILFAVDEDMNFYFITRPDSKKGQLIANNPFVSLTIGDAAPMSIQAFGSAHRIIDKDEQRKAIDMIIESAGKKADFWPPIFHIKKGDANFAVYKIATKGLRTIDLSLETISSNTPLFTQIIG